MSRCIVVLMVIGCSPMVYVHGVPNLRAVDAPPARAVYRGGEPTAQGWRYLHDELHVCSVVQLDYDWERPPGVVPPDGVSIVPVSMPPADADDLLRGPTKEQLIYAATALAAEPHVGWCAVYVHCAHGHDRTGIVVALYRHMFQGWSKQRAYAEARSLGFHPALLGLLHAWEAVP